MPELPEVETMRMGILPVVGSRIRRLQAVASSCKPIAITPPIDAMQKRLVGKAIAGVDRIGKRVVLRCSEGESLVFEPRMTGLVLLSDPPSLAHLRFRIDLTAGPHEHLWYWDRRGLGSVRLFRDAELEVHFGEGRLGRDALAISLNDLRAQLGQSRREIKPALLDQRAVAGIGNLYASEMLHLSRISPFLACHRLTDAQWRKLYAAMRRILLAAIAHEGSTLSDGTYRNALNQAGGYQNYHRVYDRAGQNCPACKRTLIVRAVQAQRATFYCPRCQTKSG